MPGGYSYGIALLLCFIVYSGEKRVVVKTKVFYGVSVADIFYYFSNRFDIICHFAPLHHTTKIVAKYSAEVMMSRIGEQGTAVGKHTYKGSDMSRGGHIYEMLFHSSLMVEKPPRRSVLDLSLSFSALETAY